MASSPKVRVLVVEDEFLIAAELSAILEDAGHAVVGPAGSVAAARALLVDGQMPDLAVIDANLRGETSERLAEDLRRLGIPFCVCTGYQPGDLKAQFGDVITLQKPVSPGTLLNVVRTMARAPR